MLAVCGTFAVPAHAVAVSGSVPTTAPAAASAPTVLHIASAQPLHYFERDGLAIGGYDPVAYFTQGRAVRGSAVTAAEWGGQTWHFATTEHRAAFAADPLAYAPQFGGYCSFGVGLNDKARSSSEAWTLDDGKLYLNQSPLVNSLWRTLNWVMLPAARHNWPQVAPPGMAGAQGGR